MTQIQDTPNLGPKSAEMLRQAGIHSFEELCQVGAVLAFLRVKQAIGRPSLNLLWAMHGAISGKKWNALTAKEREALLTQLDEAERN